MNAFAGIRPNFPRGSNPTPLAFFPGVCSGGYLFSSGGPTPTTHPPIFTLLRQLALLIGKPFVSQCTDVQDLQKTSK